MLIGLFISGDVLLSKEGTTQGDPLAMPFYALATITLLQCLPLDVVQVWYVDDACAGGKLCMLRDWWDKLWELVPNLDILLMLLKLGLSPRAICSRSFSGSGIRITSEDRPYLGAAIGSDCYVNRFVADKVKGWADEATELS